MDYIFLIAELFLTFLLIGTFTFGGGYAIMSLIQSEIVFGKGWITESVFTDIAAISQITPGPIGLNCATYVGYEVAGITGSLAASIALVLPSFVIMLAIVKFYVKYSTTPMFTSVLGSLRPAVAGLIGAAAIGLMWNIRIEPGSITANLITDNFPDLRSWIVFALALGASLFSKLGPVKILGLGALLGLLLYI